MRWLQKLLGSEQMLPTLPEQALYIDVRSPVEYAGGHLPGALNLPLEQVASQIATQAPDLDQPIVVYCASGMRSGQARAVLLQLGYRQVSNGGGVGSLSLRLGKPLQSC